MHLLVVTYHYIGTQFRGISALASSAFVRQIDYLRTHYQMATIESALAFLQGKSQTRSNLCLLTFDDGLRDHYTVALPILAERKIEGVFFIITRCIEKKWVAPAHMLHLLMANLSSSEIRQKLLRMSMERMTGVPSVPSEEALISYPYDPPEVGSLKYLVNFLIPVRIRDEILRELFLQYVGEERSYAEMLYLSWDEVRHMQSYGMHFGGHSSSHYALGDLSPEEQQADIMACWEVLSSRLKRQTLVPFAYPYASKRSYSDHTVSLVKRSGFDCAFTGVRGLNIVGEPLFRIRRIDTNDVPSLTSISGNEYPTSS